MRALYLPSLLRPAPTVVVGVVVVEENDWENEPPDSVAYITQWPVTSEIVRLVPRLMLEAKQNLY